MDSSLISPQTLLLLEPCLVWLSYIKLESFGQRVFVLRHALKLWIVSSNLMIHLHGHVVQSFIISMLLKNLTKNLDEEASTHGASVGAVFRNSCTVHLKNTSHILFITIKLRYKPSD